MADVRLKTNVDGQAVDLSHAQPDTNLYSFRSTKRHTVNIPVCKGALKYYQTPAAKASLHAVTSTAQDSDVPECPAARKFTSYMQQQLQHARRCLEAAKQRQRAAAQKRMNEDAYSLGDYVWLSTANLRSRLHGTPKLMPRFVGPFKITKVVNDTTYQLDIGDTHKKVHNVFHSSLLKRCKGAPPKQPLPIVLSEDADARGAYERFEVEMILDHRVDHRRRSKSDGSKTTKRDDGVKYLVKWKGYDAIHNTWEPASNVDRAPLRLQEYWQKWCRNHPGETPLYSTVCAVA